MYSTFPAHTQIAPLLPNSSSSSSKLPLAAKPTSSKNPKPKTRFENGSKNFCQIRVLKPEILSTKRKNLYYFKPQKQILDTNSAAAATTYLQTTDRTSKSVACKMASFHRAGERAWALHLPPGSLTRHLATQLSQSLCE
jgi:hypothetical protein